MDDKKFEDLLRGLHQAHRERDYGDPGEKFTASVIKQVRYAKARKVMEREESRTMFEAALLRFAGGAAAFAILLLAYGGSHGVGLAGAADMVPKSSVQVLIINAGGLL